MSDTAPPSALPVWHDDSAAIARAIRATRAPFKIVLKTRNDPIFLQDWIDHHAALVGPQALVIADNMSDDPQVLDILARAARTSCVFRFDGFHNDLHDRAKYPDLFAALIDSSHWITLLDTDERLIWMEPNGDWLADARVLDRLAAHADLPALPGVLIDNFARQADRFILRPGDEGLESLIRWGKPVLNTAAPVGPGHKCHNIQFERRLFMHDAPAQFFQLHLLNLIPQQRLRANREKLVKRGFFPPGVTDQEIARTNPPPKAPPLLRRCVTETRRLLANQVPQDPGTTFRLLPDGQIDAPAEQRARLEQLIRTSADRLKAMLPG